MALLCAVGSCAAAGSTEKCLATGDLAGYRHTFERSLFYVGSHVHWETNGTKESWVGTEGVFSRRVSNGAVNAVSNAGSSALAVPGLTPPEVHLQRVQDYFVGAGLPECEIIATAAANELQETQPEDAVLESSTGVLNRGILGMRVLNSRAFARFNELGQVTAEKIYWPRLPGAVVQRAWELNTALKEPQTAQEVTNFLQARLGLDSLEIVETAIYHPTEYEDAPVEAKVVLMTRVGGSEIVAITPDGELL